jgi:hypothetical protein
MRILGLVLGAALGLGVLLAGCAGSDEGSAPVAGGEEAWLSLLVEQGLMPDEGRVEIAFTEHDGELAITITVPPGAPGELTFGDGLYGATAYTFVDGSWKRVDTAEIRTEIAPILKPGESASLRLPVEEADSYRVLVPVDGVGAWADAA